ncbi:MAG: hypothetical protein WCL61_03225 [bacterium]
MDTQKKLAAVKSLAVVLAPFSSQILGVPTQEQSEIYSRALNLLNSGRAKHHDLNALFTKQLEHLKKQFNVHDSIIEACEQKRLAVVATAGILNISGQNLPFLPIIPRYVRDETLLPWQFLVAYHEIHGILHVLSGQPPKFPSHDDDVYYILNVDDGENLISKTGKDCAKLIKKRNRLALNLDETFALCTHTETLGKHGLIAAGSMDEKRQVMPQIYLDNIKTPTLSTIELTLPGYGHSGAASCEMRI